MNVVCAPFKPFCNIALYSDNEEEFIKNTREQIEEQMESIN